MRKTKILRPYIALGGCSLLAFAATIIGCSAADDLPSKTRDTPKTTTGGPSTSTGTGGTGPTGTGGATTTTTTGTGGATGGSTTTSGGSGATGGAGGSNTGGAGGSTSGGTGGTAGSGGAGATGGGGGSGGAGGSGATGGAGGTGGSGATGGAGGAGGSGATGGKAGAGGAGGSGATGGAGGSGPVDAGGGKGGGPVSDGGTSTPDAGARPPIGSAACGTAPPTNKVGGPVGQFIAQDHNGNTVALSDYCGKAVYLDLGAMWCGPCQEAAAKLEAKYQKYKDRGFITLSLLIQNTARKVPTQADLQAWAKTYGLTTPVLNDGSKTVYQQVWPGAGAIPQMALIKPDGTLHSTRMNPPDSEIEKILP